MTPSNTPSLHPTPALLAENARRQAPGRAEDGTERPEGISGYRALPDGVQQTEQLDIMVTVACNARCAFCVQEATFKPFQTGDDAFFVALRRHLADFHACGGRRVVVTGGEPLLFLPRVLAVLKELKPYADLEVKALYTNGSRLLESLDTSEGRTVAQDLAAAGLGCVNLSVHHDDDAVNRRMFVLPRRPSTAQIAAHLLDCDLPFRLNLTVQKGGIETAEALARYVRWGFALGAESIYVRELFRYSSDSAMCTSDRKPVEYSRAHAVAAAGLLDGLLAAGDYLLCGDRHEALRVKREWELEYLPAGRRVFLSSLEIGTEAADGYPYLVFMPDGKLYRGWLGERHEISGLHAESKSDGTR